MVETNAKLAVDLERLTALIGRAGRPDQLSRLRAQVDEGYFHSINDRNAWIVLLACGSDAVSFEEIAACFGASHQDMGLTRAAITHILNQCGEEAVRKKSRRQRALTHLRSLDSRAGRERAVAVMHRAAQDRKFWFERTTKSSWRRLSKNAVLQELGFTPPPYELLGKEIWRILQERKIIDGVGSVFVAIRYGLGEEDPVGYVKRLYYGGEEDRRIVDALKIINERLEKADLLTISRGALAHYMKAGGIAFKNRRHGLIRHRSES